MGTSQKALDKTIGKAFFIVKGEGLDEFNWKFLPLISRALRITASQMESLETIIYLKKKNNKILSALSEMQCS